MPVSGGAGLRRVPRTGRHGLPELFPLPGVAPVYNSRSLIGDQLGGGLSCGPSVLPCAACFRADEWALRRALGSPEMTKCDCPRVNMRVLDPCMGGNVEGRCACHCLVLTGVSSKCPYEIDKEAPRK